MFGAGARKYLTTFGDLFPQLIYPISNLTKLNILKILWPPKFQNEPPIEEFATIRAENIVPSYMLPLITWVSIDFTKFSFRYPLRYIHNIQQEYVDILVRFAILKPLPIIPSVLKEQNITTIGAEFIDPKSNLRNTPLICPIPRRPGKMPNIKAIIKDSLNNNSIGDDFRDYKESNAFFTLKEEGKRAKEAIVNNNSI